MNKKVYFAIKKKKKKIVGFLADTVLKFSAEKNIFIKQAKHWNFLHFLIISPVQCPKEKNLMQIFSWYLVTRFFELYTTLCTPG